MRIMDGKKRLGVLCESGLCSSSPSPNRRQRSVDKRVVSVPIVDTEAPPRAKGAGETTPPEDSWAWRKYGQKPIKGSPYPRGYYRCSSSKGCPARKQVERSRVDPTMLVVTYSGNHVHSPNTDTDTKTTCVAKGGAAELDPDPTIHESPQHEFPPDLIADEPDLMAMPNDFWFSGLGSTFSTTWAELALEDCAKSGGDDELFDGLGELPEYSVAYRRNYLERQTAAG